MRILAVDTATESCGAAVVCDGLLLAEMITVSGQTHSRHLMKTIRRVLEASETTLSELDGFAVTRGPGSFTGLRIGISTVKGLAAVTAKPLVGISNLEALAAQMAAPSLLLCPLLDARKKEVYFAAYRFIAGNLEKRCREKIGTPLQVLAEIQGECLFAGSGAVKYRKLISDRLGDQAYFGPPHQDLIRPSTVAFLSMNRFTKSETDDFAAFVPNYIRHSDAELNLLKRKLMQ